MIKMFASDLDGTIKVIRKENRIDNIELESWRNLGKEKKIRVLATGRNLKLISKTLRDDAPFDYMVFSSGAGIIDWRNKKILKQTAFKFKQIKSLCEYLLELDLPFFLFHNIPENHNSYLSPKLYKQQDSFFGNKQFYKIHSQIIPDLENINKEELFTQLLITTEVNEDVKLDMLKKEIAKNWKYSCIDVTSIFQGGSRMLEIFPLGINKGNALKIISEIENILPSETVTFGNDYNDIEMLEWSQNSYITKGSPKLLSKIATEIGYVNNCTVASKIDHIIELGFKI